MIVLNAFRQASAAESKIVSAAVDWAKANPEGVSQRFDRPADVAVERGAESSFKPGGLDI